MDWKKCVVIDFESIFAPRKSDDTSKAKEAIRRLRDNGFRVEITSPKCGRLDDISVIEDFLVENGIEFDYVRYGIPPCLCYVASNAIQFTGDVPKLLSQIAEISE